MNIKPRNKVSPNFSMSGLTDIIFLLLIFFMLTSTLVSPNAIDILLPKSNSQVVTKKMVTIEVTQDDKYRVDNEEVKFEQVEEVLKEKLKGVEDPTVILNLDKRVTVDNMVKVMNVGSDLGVKMILGTEPLK